MKTFILFSSLKLLTFFSSCTSTHESLNQAPYVQQLIKIKEHVKTKDVFIMKKINISVHEDTGSAQRSPDVFEVSEVTETHLYEEMSCPSPHPKPLTTHVKFARKLLSQGIFYVPMASSFFYKRMSVMLRQKRYHDLDSTKACLRGIISKDKRQIEGFGTTFEFPCEGDLLDAKCKKIVGDKVFAVHSTAIWSDGATFVLLVGCNLNEGKGAWVLASHQASLDPSLKNKILDEISQYGFDPADYIEFSYSQCETPTLLHLKKHDDDDKNK